MRAWAIFVPSGDHSAESVWRFPRTRRCASVPSASASHMSAATGSSPGETLKYTIRRPSGERRAPTASRRTSSGLPPVTGTAQTPHDWFRKLGWLVDVVRFGPLEEDRLTVGAERRAHEKALELGDPIYELRSGPAHLAVADPRRAGTRLRCWSRAEDSAFWGSRLGADVAEE